MIDPVVWAAGSIVAGLQPSSTPALVHESKRPVPFVRHTDVRSGFEHEAGARSVCDGAVAAPAEPKDP